MTAPLSALIWIDEVATSDISGTFLVACPEATALPLQHERRPATAEVPHVDALGAADPHAPDERVVDVAEEHQRRRGLADRLQHGGAPPLEPAALRVVDELGAVGR